MTTRAQILVRGIVQGVGFRPFVYLHASRMALTGNVKNNSAGVLIEVEGDVINIDKFLRELHTNPPPLSKIDSIECRTDLTPADYPDFMILESDAEGQKQISVSADVATCDDCLKELFDSQNRRYRYPFINCTNCGPRFTIVEGVPYDRENTTMRHFEMCDACLREYGDPVDRRFHAEPTACFACGPALTLRDQAMSRVGLAGEEIDQARALLRSGYILAIKGIGGFHLACDARSKAAVGNLRNRKVRYDKPFALMAPSVAVIREYCEVSIAEEQLLQSVKRPIVLLKQTTKKRLPAEIAPGLNTLGFMLPYTPLHHLLLENLDSPLVMTSGNMSDEPICYLDPEVRDRLEGIADYFLVHNRQIHIRTDDSVARVLNNHEVVLRRSRGYAPAPIGTSFEVSWPILACGAELKNTFCLARGHEAFVSHHIGDLENFETLQAFRDGIEHYQRLFEIEPQVVAYDLHPEYLSTKYALSLDHVENKVAVQHHHAHIASCLADNLTSGPVIGVAFDGLGFGLDGKFWGGEFLVADFLQAERIAHLAYVPLPGGTRAIREPWRMAAAYLRKTFGDNFNELDLEFNQQLDIDRWKTLSRMIDSGMNCPESSSMGRLFDAVASLTGGRNSITYEGQAAIEFEALVDQNTLGHYEFQIEDNEIRAEAVIRAIVWDQLQKVTPAEIAAKFHLAVANLISTVAMKIRRERGLNRVALSGGVFQNIYLLNHTCERLLAEKFEVLTHRNVPANDGGISLGQVAVANARIQSGRID